MPQDGVKETVIVSPDFCSPVAWGDRALAVAASESSKSREITKFPKRKYLTLYPLTYAGFTPNDTDAHERS